MNNLNLYSETVSGYTAVSDIFIDEYVPSANGDFVKVYLYLLRLFTRKNSNLSISSLADTFNQTENDVMRALRYWDRSGLVQLSYDDNNQLCGITLKDIANHGYSPEPDDRIAAPEINNDAVDNSVSEAAADNEPVSSSSASDSSADLIEYLFEYCVSKGKTSIRYIEKVALAWADEGISTVDAAKDEVSNHNEAVFSVMKAFGLNSREPGKVEKDLIIKWTDIYCFETDIIVEACNRTMKATHQPSFEYADSILTKWHTSNIRSSEDIRKADAQYEAGKAAKAAKSSNVIKQNANRFNNYQQRPKKSDDWYNSLLSNNN